MKTASIDQPTSPISTIGTRLLRNVATAMALIGRGNITSNANGAVRNQRRLSSFAFDGQHNIRYRWVAAATVLFLLCGFHHGASANPVFEIADGGNWDLPIVPSLNAIIQRGVYQSGGKSYNADGKEVSGPSVTEYIGITSFVHLFSFDALPKVGFYWEVFQSVADIVLRGSIQSISGLGRYAVATNC
jgi:hypothetical protein